MNPELESRIEAYLFAEMSENERAQFENELQRDAEFKALVEDRRAQMTLLNRAFLRQKVRDLQNETSDLRAVAPNVEQAKVVTMRPFRFAAAAAIAGILAAGAYFLWNQSEKLQDSISDTQASNEMLKEIIQKTPQNDGQATQNDQITASQTENQPEEVIVLGEKTGEKLPKIASGDQTGSNQTPSTYNDSKVRGLKSQIKNTEGERLFNLAYQKANLNQFKGSVFAGFATFFDQKKFAEAIRILDKMEVSTNELDARDLLLGIAHLENGDYSEADKYLQNVFDPPNIYYSEAQWWLALTFCKEGKLDSARELFQKISKTKGHPFQEKSISLVKVF